MPDRENVISCLEQCLDDSIAAVVPADTVREVIALLKAQEAVEPRVGHDGWYRCGGCNNSLASGERVKHFYGHPWPKYCEECGKKVRWG